MTYELHKIDRNAWIPGSNCPIVTDYKRGYETIREAVSNPLQPYGYYVYSTTRDMYAHPDSVMDYRERAIPASEIQWVENPCHD